MLTTKVPLISIGSRGGSGFVLSKQMLIDLAAGIDLILIVGSAFLIKFLYVDVYAEAVKPENAGHISYIGIIAIVTCFLCVSLWQRGHYHEDGFENWRIRSGWIQLASTIFVSFGVGVFALFALKESALFSRVWVLSWCVAAYIILLLTKALWAHQLRALAANGYLKRRVFLLGAGEALRDVRSSFMAEQNKIALAGVGDIGDVPFQDSNVVSSAIELGQLGELDEIVLALPPEEMESAANLIRRLRLLPVDIKVALDFQNFNFKLLEVSQVGDMNFAAVQKKPISGWNVILKRVEDYILASLGIVLFLPAMAVIALAVKLDSKGPVLFRQRRHGCNHEVIEVIKFRTMTVLEDGEHIKQATKDDNRITRVGRFLRRTSLDELPQLFNVLKGDMSLVGPRPHAIAHNDHYSLILEDYASRHRVKPGITGWAQVNGFRGETPDPELMKERVRYDLEYIEQWSIWFDLEIIFVTPLYGFVSRRAY